MIATILPSTSSTDRLYQRIVITSDPEGWIVVTDDLDGLPDTRPGVPEVYKLQTGQIGTPMEAIHAYHQAYVTETGRGTSEVVRNYWYLAWWNPDRWERIRAEAQWSYSSV